MIDFSNVVKSAMLERVAEADEHELVREVSFVKKKRVNTKKRVSTKKRVNVEKRGEVWK